MKRFSIWSAATVSAITLGFAPGYWARTTTEGGTTSGYSDTGSLKIEIRPPTKTITDIVHNISPSAPSKPFESVAKEKSASGILFIVGLLLALFTGAGAWWFGYPFLTSHTAHLTLPLLGEVHIASALFFDAGVFAAVVGSTLLILTALAHQSVRGHRKAPEKTVTATTGPREVD